MAKRRVSMVQDLSYACKSNPSDNRQVQATEVDNFQRPNTWMIIGWLFLTLKKGHREGGACET